MTNNPAVPPFNLFSIPNCPITVEIRYEECKPLADDEKHPTASGIARYRFAGTTEQFNEWCDTPGGALSVHHLWSMHERLFVTFANGEREEIT